VSVAKLAALIGWTPDQLANHLLAETLEMFADQNSGGLEGFLGAIYLPRPGKRTTRAGSRYPNDSWHHEFSWSYSHRIGDPLILYLGQTALTPVFSPSLSIASFNSLLNRLRLPRPRFAMQLKALKTEAKGSGDRVRVVVVSGDLPVVADGCPDPRCPLDGNARIYDQRVVALSGSAKGRRRAVQGWRGGGYQQV